MRILWPIRELGREEGQYPGVMTIAAVLRDNGFATEVVAADPDSIARRVAEGEPAVLAYSTMTVHARPYVELNRAVKRRQPHVFSVFGGAHPTYFPEMVEEEGVDAVCIGEGEDAMLDLVRAVAEGRPVVEIPNWWVKQNGAIHRNPVRPLIEDLDRLPPPDWEVFREASGRPGLHAIVMTGRGCPYGCTYCYNHVFKKLYRGKGNPVRRRSVGHVLRELHQLKSAGCRFVRFMDDLFILDRAWVLEFADRYGREIGLPFSCLVRANLVTEDVVEALARAGCHRMMMGVETGSEELRYRVLNRRMTNEEILRAAGIIKDAGIRLVTANILGIPTATLDDEWRTVELNRRLGPSYASASVLQAFPGTKIHALAAEAHMLRSDHMERLGGLGSPATLKRPDPREEGKIANLVKLFPVMVWFPWLDGVLRVAVRLPVNPGFELIHKVSYWVGSHLIAIPMRIGMVMLARKVVRRLASMVPRRGGRRRMNAA